VLYAVLLLAAFFCAVMAIRARRLLVAAMWLAGVSALVAIVLFRLGAQQVAVVELSVGAGLVTVLFVFAISIAGEEGLSEREFIPNELAIGLLVVFVGLLATMVLPVDDLGKSLSEAEFGSVFWEDREIDVLLQLVFIFTGVVTMLGILADVRKPSRIKKKSDIPQAHINPAFGTDKPVPQPVLQPVIPSESESSKETPA
jgi:uncharacterized MnhB-related membrane protein